MHLLDADTFKTITHMQTFCTTMDIVMSTLANKPECHNTIKLTNQNVTFVLSIKLPVRGKVKCFARLKKNLQQIIYSRVA